MYVHLEYFKSPTLEQTEPRTVQTEKITQGETDNKEREKMDQSLTITTFSFLETTHLPFAHSLSNCYNFNYNSHGYVLFLFSFIVDLFDL